MPRETQVDYLGVFLDPDLLYLLVFGGFAIVVTDGLQDSFAPGVNGQRDCAGATVGALETELAVDELQSSLVLRGG